MRSRSTFVCVWGGGAFVFVIRRNEKKYVARKLSTLLSSNVCRGSFPKNSECFASRKEVGSEGLTTYYGNNNVSHDRKDTTLLYVTIANIF